MCVRGPTRRRSRCLLSESGAPSHDGAGREQGGWGGVGGVQQQQQQHRGPTCEGGEADFDEGSTAAAAVEQRSAAAAAAAGRHPAQEAAAAPGDQRRHPTSRSDNSRTRSLSSCLSAGRTHEHPLPLLLLLLLYGCIPSPFSSGCARSCLSSRCCLTSPVSSVLLLLSPPPLSLCPFNPSVSGCLSSLWLPNQPVNAQSALCDWYERV